MSRHDAALHHSTIIERLAAIPPGSPVSRALRNRPELIAGLDAGYQALLGQPDPARAEQLAITAFCAGLHGDEVVAGHFHDLLGATDQALADLIRREAENAALPGPYGTWPPGPLSAEDLDGPAWRADPPLRRRLGLRLAAALEHAHLITLHPRDAGDTACEALARAGWQPAEILALNGLIAWIGALSPVISGLRAYAFARHPHLARSPLAAAADG